MPQPVWESLLRQIDAWNILFRVVRMYMLGEPLLNADVPGMVGEMWRRADRIEVTTNGTRLDSRVAWKLNEAGLSYLRISVYGTSRMEYLLATGRPCHHLVLRNAREFRKTRDAYRDRYGEAPVIHAQLVNPDSDVAEFQRQWDGIADYADAAFMHNWGSSQQVVQFGQQSSSPKVCAKLFYELAVHANGDVSACCVDWSRKLVLGNIMKESLREIWEGEKLKELRELHLAGRRGEHPACGQCTMINQQKDNLDSLVKIECPREALA